MFSIRRYLLVTLLAVAAVSMAVTGWWSYREAAHEVEELFDAQLAQSARVLMATLASRPLRVDGNDRDTVVFPAWRPEGDAMAEQSTRNVAAMGHKYETRLAFQLWEGAGERLLMRSANAPEAALAAFRAGYAEVMLDGEKFQVFTLEQDGTWLQVAQDDYMRGELAMEIAVASLWPHLLGLPLMALLIWWLVRRGLQPLDDLRAAIAGRDIANLHAVEAQPSVELQPVIDELNGLLARLDASVVRERRFTADAAHELRTPLAVLRIHAENAMAALNEDERKTALTMLVRGVDRASRLVEQLLTLARVEPEAATHRFETVRLNALVREELAALAPVAARRGQEVDFTDDGETEVNGNRALLGILVRNLVDNALRYSPDGAPVRVFLQQVASGERVQLRVEDEGPGIAPELARRVFERFFRADTSRGDGAGLGLSIVARIAELHGGTVQVRSPQAGARGGISVELAALRTVKAVPAIVAPPAP
jgi:two-component system sensor histidine kinase QseC